MTFSIRMNDDERRLAESYAKKHNMSLSEAFKKALFEKIEEEFDTVVAGGAYSEYLTSGKPSRPFSELVKELDL